jgi:hypothetical protein
MPLVYVASKAKHSHWWRALRAAGVPISAAWIDAELNEAGADEPTADAWRVHWDKCVAEASQADICLFVCNESETACGALIEAGAALAAGRQVFVVSPYEWTFSNHPRCRVFPSLEMAIAAIVAMREGERGREAANGMTFI